MFLAAPHRIIGDAEGNVKAIEVVKTRLGEYDRRDAASRFSTDEIQRFECDTVILAVGETVDLDFCQGFRSGDEGERHRSRSTASRSKPAGRVSTPAAT